MNASENFKLTPELMEKIENCKSPEELVKLAEDNGARLTLEEAQDAMNNMKRELSDEELDNIAGGSSCFWDEGSACPCPYYTCDSECLDVY